MQKFYAKPHVKMHKIFLDLHNYAESVKKC